MPSVTINFDCDTPTSMAQKSSVANKAIKLMRDKPNGTFCPFRDNAKIWWEFRLHGLKWVAHREADTIFIREIYEPSLFDC